MDTKRDDATPVGADADGAEPGTPGVPAAPGEDSPTPSGTPAEVVGEVREYATLEWVMPFWGRRPGHTERLELTEIVRGAIDGGKLKVVETAPAPRRRRRG